MKISTPIAKILLAAAICATPLATFAAEHADSMNAANTLAQNAKVSYKFKQKFTPEHILNYDCALFYTEGKSMHMCVGEYLSQLGQHITDAAMNPAGINYVLISQDKKQPVAAVFSPTVVDEQILKFKNKKIGNPSAVTYTPDAMNILLATGKEIKVVDARSFAVLDTLPIPFEPTRMEMSSNGYFIALDNGNDVCIYNYENKRPRFTRKYDEKITGAHFNKDASEFAILTEDGILSIYDTRQFLVKNTIDNLEGGIAFDYNFDGKYVAVATAPDRIDIVNLLKSSDREHIDVENGAVTQVLFVPDSRRQTLLAYNNTNALQLERMTKLQPYYGKLIAAEAQARLNEWAKMLPGETLEQYNERVNDETRQRQMRLYEGEISTSFAPDLASMASVSLGKYDRVNQLLDLDFDNMPSILLPVPESDLSGFNSASDLSFRNAKYGVMNDDGFELIYAEVYNAATGKTYTYDNIDRVPLSFVDNDDNVVSIEVIQQQQMEEMRLQEIRQKVVDAAKQQNVISDHTNIVVDSRVEPDYDSDGNRILNYIVNVTYQVDPEFTAQEDFGPGKYHISESGAASSMLKIVKEAFEGDFAQYLKPGKKMLVKISGTADATPIVSRIMYDGSFGELVDEPVYKDGVLSAVTVTTKEPVHENEQLAFLRAMAVKNNLTENVAKLADMNTAYQYNIAVSHDKGSQFRRINAEFTFVDAF